MQFITTGNRIAVENFTLGDLYTITFTNGTYINSACIGIGENFVSFQRNEPELLFTLNMETAELVSSIDLYAGGTGTNNYNDLSNKPQINDVELVGNKSLSDLGIQATISDLDTIRSGAAAGATAVQPAALADYQPVISDLDTIRSGAAAGATAVQPAALADYQPIIDSSHMLDADLVDDTTATHKFATAAQLSQIGINENNILLNWETGRNIIDYTSADIQKVNGANLTITVASDKKMMINGTQSSSASAGIGIPFTLPAGTWYVSGCPSGGGNNTYRVDLRYTVGETQFVDDADTGNGFLVTANADTNLVYNIRIAAGYACNNLTISPMIIPKAIYDVGGTNYQPYAMSNVELTAAIQAIQAQLNQ